MTKFTDLGLSPDIIQAVTDAGYDTPTPIQAQAIPVALTGRDVLGIAQTGTGKTAAFTLPMIERLAAGRARARMPRSLVLLPTRELADQVAAAFDKYSANHKLTWALLIGGVSFEDQLRKLDRGVDVLIATPGRLLDHFERGKLLLTGVQIMVVDEADRMLDMGFIPDIERIFKLTPANRQTLFFSATMPPEITRLTTQFLRDPTRIEASRPAMTAETIAQHLVRIPMSDPKAKRMALRALAGREDVKNGIVFCNRKTDVDIVAKSLQKHGLDALPIHGDLDQSVRTRTLESFRNGGLKLLVASDVAARGLDIPAVSHVFNYDVPYHADDYVHRIGRTGRAGRTGEAFMLVTPADSKALDKVLKLIKVSPDEEKLDLDWSLAEGGDERRDRGRGGRGRDEGRGRDRDRSSRRSAPRETEPVEAEAPAADVPEPRRDARPAEDRPAREARPPRGDRAPREERAAREDRPPREERPSREERAHSEARDHRETRRSRESRRDDDSRDQVVGFGADTPAFLLRAAAPAPAPQRRAPALQKN
jgi:superfamily II DNA/RNA helicase